MPNSFVIIITVSFSNSKMEDISIFQLFSKLLASFSQLDLEHVLFIDTLLFLLLTCFYYELHFLPGLATI